MTMHEPTVGIVVPCWNDEDQTLRCLKALGALTYANHRVIVVDNGSSSSSFQRLASAASPAKLIRLDNNRGFSGAVNQGVQQALEIPAAYVWVLNNDAVVAPDSLSALVAQAEADATLGAVGSVLDEGDALVYGGHLNLWSGYATHVRRRMPSAAPDYLIGASLLIRAQALHDVGPFDEGYFLYWEDADFSLRLRRAGWKLAIAADSNVQHHGHGSMAFNDPIRDFHYTRSSLRFLRRHARWPLVATTLLTARRLASRVRYRRWANAGAILRAVGVRDAQQRPRSDQSGFR
jgi:GT2 family glycosyltransferase